MCVMSMVIDHYQDRWKEKDWIQPPPPQTWPLPSPGVPTVWPTPISIGEPINPAITKREFDEFKKDFEEFKKLVKRAIKYDDDNGEPDCETDTKVELIKKIAKELGIDIADITIAK